VRDKDTNTFGASGCAKSEWPNCRLHLPPRGIRDEVCAHDGQVRGKALVPASNPEEGESIEKTGAAFQFDRQRVESRPFLPAISGGSVLTNVPFLFGVSSIDLTYCRELQSRGQQGICRARWQA